MTAAKRKVWKQGDISFDAALDEERELTDALNVEGREGGRIADRELAKLLGSMGGKVGGYSRVEATNALFRTLNSYKASWTRWDAGKPPDQQRWNEDWEKKLDEARSMCEQLNK